MEDLNRSENNNNNNDENAEEKVRKLNNLFYK